MKKTLFLAFSLALFSVGAEAQKTKVKAKSKAGASVAVPAAVNTSFDSSYADITSKKWSKTLNGNYVAKFKNTEEFDETAEYSKDGQWQKSKIKWDAEKLPENIRLSLDSTYAGAKIVSVEKIKLKDINPFYNIKITTADNTSKLLLVSEEGTITE